MTPEEVAKLQAYYEALVQVSNSLKLTSQVIVAAGQACGYLTVAYDALAVATKGFIPQPAAEPVDQE